MPQTARPVVRTPLKLGGPIVCTPPEPHRMAATRRTACKSERPSELQASPAKRCRVATTAPFSVPAASPTRATPRWGKASTRAEAHKAVANYNRKYRGIKSGDTAPLSGKSSGAQTARACPLSVPALHAALLRRCIPAGIQGWKAGLPSRAKLHRGRFGRPTADANWTVEGSFSTCMVPILTSGMLPFIEFASF